MTTPPPIERGADGRFQKKEQEPILPGSETEHPLSRVLFGWVENKRIGTILLVVVIALLAMFVLLDLALVDHSKSGKPWWTYAAMGFFGFSIAVLSGWPLGKLLRRSEDYYGEADTTPNDVEAKS